MKPLPENRELKQFLTRRRTEPDCFLPDLTALPPYHQRAKPYIFSTTEVAKLLKAAA